MRFLIVSFVFSVFFCSCTPTPESRSPEPGDLIAKPIKGDVASLGINDKQWSAVKPKVIPLMAQPMVAPRPKTTTTPEIAVQALHDAKWLVLRMKWKSKKKNYGQKVGTFSDGVAVQFPAKRSKTPPPIFMGSKKQPVQIFHWRAMYQLDKKKGFHTMRDIYPNMIVDSYPVDWSTQGTRTKAKTLAKLTEKQADAWTAGRAGRNPQSFVKPNGVDVIFAEGYGSSSVADDIQAEANAQWADGEWTVTISRPFDKDKVDDLKVGTYTFVAFAVWQGAQKEAGSRKSLTMAWTPLYLSP